MKIFYWAPFLSKIATVSSVIRSINIIKKYHGEKVEISIIDAVGEWESVNEKITDIKVIKLYKKNLYNSLPKKGILSSRFTQIFIFCFSFFKLLKILNHQKPDYLVAHLIVSLPLMLMTFVKSKTKLVLRISGLPKLNFLRKKFWNLYSNNVFKVTSPTDATYEKLKLLKIFRVSQLEILYDPVIFNKEIIEKKKEDIDEKFKNKRFIISIGRLTKQKNFSLLLMAFKKIVSNEKDLNLIILGEGEEYQKLTKFTKELNIDKSVYFLGYKNNIYKYLKNAECFILTSLWEDPGFVLLESAFLNIPIISSDCPNGPKEILGNNERGFLFNNNDLDSLVFQYNNFKSCKKNDLKNKVLKAKKYSRNYSTFNHYKKIRQILNLSS